MRVGLYRFPQEPVGPNSPWEEIEGLVDASTSTSDFRVPVKGRSSRRPRLSEMRGKALSGLERGPHRHMRMRRWLAGKSKDFPQP